MHLAGPREVCVCITYSREAWIEGPGGQEQGERVERGAAGLGCVCGVGERGEREREAKWQHLIGWGERRGEVARRGWPG